MSHVTNATIPSKANSRLFAMEQTLQHVILRSQNFGRMGNCTSMQIEDARKDYLESLSNGQQALLIDKFHLFSKAKMWGFTILELNKEIF